MTATGERSGASWAQAWAPLGFALVGLLVVVIVVVGARSGGDSGGEDTATGEVFLEPASSEGPSPFTEPLDPPTAETVATTVLTGSTATIAAASGPVSGAVPPTGSPPYGGSGDDSVCDRQALIDFLTTGEARGRAWAGVRGIAYDDLETYINSLVPTVLLYDTRVTNHGFSDGRATPRQSVLQAGTAVLATEDGDLVARCKCGNPLLPPEPVPTAVYVGDPWPGFNPTIFVTVSGGLTATVVQTQVASQPATTETTAPDTTDSGASDPADEAQALVETTLGACGLDVTVLDAEADPDIVDTWTVQAIVDGETGLFLANLSTNEVTEGDQVSARILEGCGP